MIADWSVSIGYSHTVCQDYARSGIGEFGPYVFIADGCSSSPDTDIGARLLVLAAEKHVNTTMDMHEWHRATIGLAWAWAHSLGLPQQALDATLLAIRFVDGSPLVTIFGDGYIAQRIDGALHVTKITFEKNCPFYMSYLLDDNRKKQAKMQAAILEDIVFHPDGTSTNEQGMEIGEDFCFKFADEKADFIAIMSDGMASFLKPDVTPTGKTSFSPDPKEIFPDLLGFKNLQPGFVQRRAQRFLKGKASLGWQHFDDLSIGAIALK